MLGVDRPRVRPVAMASVGLLGGNPPLGAFRNAAVLGKLPLFKMRHPALADPSIGGMQRFPGLHLIDGERRRPASFVLDMAEQPTGLRMIRLSSQHLAKAGVGKGEMLGS